MPITISCSQCNRKYRVRDELAGKVAKCQCGQSITIPAAAAPVGAPSATAPTDAAPRNAAPGGGVPSASAPGAAVPGGPGPVNDPFSQLADELASQGTPLQPLGSRSKGKKHSGRKKGNPYLIPAIAGGAVVAVLLIAVVVVALSSGGSSNGPSGGGSTSVTDVAPAANVRWPTPEAVFEAQKKALAEKDWKTLYETCSPNSQRMIAGAMAFTTVTLARIMPEFDAIRTEYGLGTIDLTPQLLQPGDMATKERQIRAQMEKLTDRVTDKVGFFAKVMETISSEKTKDPTGMALRQMRERLVAEANAQLSNLQISGDRATATSTFTFQGSPRQEPIEFVKIDGEWRVEEKMPVGGTPSP